LSSQAGSALSTPLPTGAAGLEPVLPGTASLLPYPESHMRLFIGIPLPQEYQHGLARLRHALAPKVRSKLGWTREGNWHVTLKFFGEVRDERAVEIGQALAGLALGAFSLQAGGAGFFPNARNPRVFWAGLIQGAQGCALWAEAVETAMESLGFPRESRPFRPHLTLARIREARRDDWEALRAEAARIEWPEVLVNRAVLWRSRLGPGGPAYEELRQVEAS